VNEIVVRGREPRPDTSGCAGWWMPINGRACSVDDAKPEEP